MYGFGCLDTVYMKEMTNTEDTNNKPEVQNFQQNWFYVKNSTKKNMYSIFVFPNLSGYPLGDLTNSTKTINPIQRRRKQDRLWLANML